MLESALLLLLACCISLGQGEDRNWDLLNYHLYNAFSLVEGRFMRDLYPVGIQSYFNPLLDVPYYLLSVELLPGFPRVVAFLSGLPFGLLIVVVLRIARIALPAATPAEAWLAPIATAIGISGSATWSEIGTTFGDIPVSALALAGLVAPFSLLSNRDTMASRAWYRAMLVAGAMIGAATGLKPTACILALGALAALTLAAGGVRRACFGAVAFCLGWGTGFAVAYGWWGWMLYRRFDNPFFPLFNHVFASPWVPADIRFDARFMPRDALQAAFYPFFWLRGRAFIVAEVDVRDPRFALAYIAIVVLAVSGFVRRMRRESAFAGTALQPVGLAVCSFVAVSYVAWEILFSILRYALALEALTGVIIIHGLRAIVGHARLVRLPASWPPAGPRPASNETSEPGEVIETPPPLVGGGRGEESIDASPRPTPLPTPSHKGRLFLARQLSVVCSIVLIAIVAVSSRPGWGRLRHYGSSVFNIHAPVVPDGATIILADKPIGFAAPFLKGNDIAFVGIVEVPKTGLLRDAIERRIRLAAPVLVLLDKAPTFYAARLRSFGREIDPATCQPIGNEFDPGLALCGTVPAGGA